MAFASHASGAIRALALELKQLIADPVEGFRVQLKNETNIFEWEIKIFGPPGTLYEGGYFKALMVFPADYPYSPPSVQFLSKMWHPNVYADGKVCISILHPPGEDEQSGELPSERWNPTQNVRTILLSVISLLNEPNCSSPANVDAAVMYRKWRDNKIKHPHYAHYVAKQVAQSSSEAAKDGVVVPTTQEEYCRKETTSTFCDEDDIVMNDGDYPDDDDEDEDDVEYVDDDNEDSGSYTH